MTIITVSDYYHCHTEQTACNPSLQNYTTASSINSSGKSFHIINKTVFQLAMLVRFGIHW